MNSSFLPEVKIAIIKSFIRANVTREELHKHILLTPTKNIDKTKKEKHLIGQLITFGAVLQSRYSVELPEIVDLINSDTITNYLFDKLDKDGTVQNVLLNNPLVYTDYDKLTGKWKEQTIQ